MGAGSTGLVLGLACKLAERAELASNPSPMAKPLQTAAPSSVGQAMPI